MRQASDFMIGNYANYKFWNPKPNNEGFLYSQVEVVGIIKDTYYFKSHLTSDNRIVKVKELYGIDVNDYWLKSFGFEYYGIISTDYGITEHRYCIHNAVDGTSDFSVILFENKDGYFGFEIMIDEDPYMCFQKDLRCVHELQNVSKYILNYDLELEPQIISKKKTK